MGRTVALGRGVVVLDPCPHCPCETQHLEILSSLEAGGCSECGSADREFAVICVVNLGGCGGSGGYRFTPSDAVAAWNREPLQYLSYAESEEVSRG